MNNKLDAEQKVIDTDELFDFDQLQRKLYFDLEEQLSDVESLKKDFASIGNPEALGDVVANVVWEQFINQVGIIAGEDFVKENRGINLNLKNEAHIQTTENFEKGKIAKNNSSIDYQQRYDDWQSNFQKDQHGNIVTHNTRTGEQEATLVRGARQKFDIGRASGSKEKGTDMDHTVSAGEFIREAKINAHLDSDEQVTFANSSSNLYEMDASHNRSKSDMKMTDWLDNPNRNGQKPKEIFDISEEQDKKYREIDKSAREELGKEVKRGEDRSRATGRESKRKETFLIGKKALKAIIMGLFLELIKNIVHKLVSWLKSSQKSFKTFLENMKEAIKKFIGDVKKHAKTASNIVTTTILSAIYGPVVNVLKKSWIFLKQGYQSLKDAIKYIKDPASKNKSTSVLILEVSKIIVAGLTAGGAILLGEVIEKKLLVIPFFAVQIPMLGSLASLLGIFLGALVSGLLGALALNLIDRIISNKLKNINKEQQIEKMNTVLVTQNQIVHGAIDNLSHTMQTVNTKINERHIVLADVMQQVGDSVFQEKSLSENNKTKNDDDLDKLFDDLNKL